MSKMPDFTFRYGPRVISGSGASVQVVGELPPGPVLVVTDAQVRALGLCDGLLAALGERAIVFDAVEADPSEATVLAATAAGDGVGSVVGIGGGSPLDVAKLAAYLIGSGDDLAAIYGVGLATAQGVPLALVPTTAGTGSEATAVAIVTVGATEKKGVSAPALYATWAVLDASLTLGLPPAATAATGIDAMVHAIEAFTSARLKNPVSDLFATRALSLLAANLPRVMADGGDVAARSDMLLGAHFAGIAFANAPVAGVHALAYPLGSRFHVPHGAANALMLLHVIEHNLDAAMDDYAALGPLVDPALAGLGRQARARGLIEALRRLIRDCGVPDRLAMVGVSADDLDMLAADAMKQTRLLVNNPCPIDEAAARRLYAAAL
jgi:alcohol dehydrogenase class IV